MEHVIRPLARIANSPNYKWWAYAAIAIGMFLTVMDQSGVNIALPRIAEHFSADIPTVQWITLGYVLSTSAMLMPMGRLSDMLGRKVVYMGGFIVFVGAAVAGGLSQSLSMVILAKVIQGCGSAAIQANGMAMVTEVFPERERGKGLGLYMTIIGTGSVSGPIVGGLLVSAYGWRSVFFAGVPVGILAFVSALLVLKMRNLPPSAYARKLKFDWGGAAMSSGALVSFLLGMTNAHKLGWTSPPILGAFIVGFTLLAAFLWWERRTADPMLDLTFFRSRVFSAGVSARFLSFLAGSSVYFLMPFYLVQGLGYPTSKAGLLMVPSSICMAIMGPISGRISDRIGTRWLTVIGMAFSSSALLIFSRLGADSPAIHVIAGMALSGLGMGIFSSPNTSAIMSSLSKEKYGIASAFLNLVRTSANVSGVALATTIVVITMGMMGYEPSLSAISKDGSEGVKAAFASGLNKAYLVAAALAFGALVISALRGESKPARVGAPQARSSASPGSDD